MGELTYLWDSFRFKSYTDFQGVNKDPGKECNLSFSEMKSSRVHFLGLLSIIINIMKNMPPREVHKAGPYRSYHFWTVPGYKSP